MSWEAFGGIVGGIAALYVAVRVSSIERLKRELDKELARFNLTYQRQLDVIVELYERLASFEEAAYNLTKPMRFPGEPSEDDARHHLIGEFQALRLLFTRRRLFLPKQIASDVWELISQIQTASQDFILMREEDLAGRQSERLRKWGEIHAEISSDVPKLREELEDRFRELLGMS